MNRIIRHNIVLSQKEWDKLKPFLLVCDIKFTSCGWGKDVLIQFESTYKECRQTINIIYLLFGKEYISEEFVDLLYL